MKDDERVRVYSADEYSTPKLRSIMRDLGKPPAPKDWRGYAARIAAAWQQAIESVIETGRLLNEAKAAVEHGDWLKLVKKLPFGERTAQRLMEIARHPVLSNPTHASVLPPSWPTLYELSRLPEPLLLAKIEDHTINPEMERSDVRVIAEAERRRNALPTASLLTTDEVIERIGAATERPKPDEVIEAEVVEAAEPDEDSEIASPEQIEANIMHSLGRMNAHARMFKKHIKLSTFNREQADRIRNAIDGMIRNWESAKSVLP